MAEHAIAECRSCKRSIIWALTERGKKIPVDAAPNVKGNIVLEQTNTDPTIALAPTAKVVAPLFVAGQVRYMPHHATCPQGESWRR